jgi:hypothetical protein
MRCVDCLPLIEEYFDGETDARTAELMAAHLSTCTDCAAALDALRFEQDMYARYDRGLEVTPALWAAVSARVARGPEPTREADGLPFLARLRGALAAMFGALALRPALASSLALLLVALTAGALWLALARRPAADKQLAAVRPNKVTSDQPSRAVPNGSDHAPTVTPGEGPVVDTPKQEGPRRDLVARAERARYVPEDVGLRRAPETDVMTLINEPLTPSPAGNVVVIKADEHDAVQDSPLAVSVASGDKGVVASSSASPDPEDTEMAQHIERAQVLLRSFKNARPAEGDTVNVAYEKSHARKLLAENATLQLDAETRGDKDTKRVLDRIEPFLLDIANLGDQPTREEVRSIKERMQKNEIIAALQVY